METILLKNQVNKTTLTKGNVVTFEKKICLIKLIHQLSYVKVSFEKIHLTLFEVLGCKRLKNLQKIKQTFSSEMKSCNHRGMMFKKKKKKRKKDKKYT